KHRVGHAPTERLDARGTEPDPAAGAQETDSVFRGEFEHGFVTRTRTPPRSFPRRGLRLADGTRTWTGPTRKTTAPGSASAGVAALPALAAVRPGPDSSRTLPALVVSA